MTQTLYVSLHSHDGGDFHVASGQLQAVMACYLIPYGLSQFVYGPLSDRIGRRPVLIIGMMIFLVGTLTIQLIPSFTALLAGSLIQGWAPGQGRHEPDRDARPLQWRRAQPCQQPGEHGGHLLPLLAPVLGGWLTELFNWRAGYWFLFGLVP